MSGFRFSIFNLINVSLRESVNITIILYITKALPFNISVSERRTGHTHVRLFLHIYQLAQIFPLRIITSCLLIAFMLSLKQKTPKREIARAKAERNDYIRQKEAKQ